MSTLLEVTHLRIAFKEFSLQPLTFSLESSECLAIVGESGSGKSLLALSLLGLGLGDVSGEVVLHHKTDSYHLLNLSQKQLSKIRGNLLGYIPQEPLTALNPLHTIKAQIHEALRLHNSYTKPNLQKRYCELLEKVGLPQLIKREKVYPHELSGGERQRVLIAIAIANNPILLIADEPTTALDASLRQQVLSLLKDITSHNHTALILISHNLPIVEHYCDSVLVLQKGILQDYMPTKSLFAANVPKSRYSMDLLEAKLPQKPTSPTSHEEILNVSHLHVRYPLENTFWGRVHKYHSALESLSFSVYRNHHLGIIGESGSGKSSLGFALLGLVQKQGIISAKFQSHKMEIIDTKNIAYRRFIQMLFQDPFGALNARLSVFDIIAEPLRIHGLDNISNRTQTAMQQVALSYEYAQRYPNELSGGERQRVALARALVLQPQVLILDEPTSALDHYLRASIAELLHKVALENNITYICISHELDIIQSLCDDVIVLQKGKLIEQGECAQVFAHPQHNYTKDLLTSLISA